VTGTVTIGNHVALDLSAFESDQLELTRRAGEPGCLVYRNPMQKVDMQFRDYW
jgi:hypothetical protein